MARSSAASCSGSVAEMPAGRIGSASMYNQRHRMISPSEVVYLGFA
jgi:hypothetical protein